MEFEIEPKLIELGNEGTEKSDILLNSKDISSFDVENDGEKKKDI